MYICIYMYMYIYIHARPPQARLAYLREYANGNPYK